MPQVSPHFHQIFATLIHARSKSVAEAVRQQGFRMLRIAASGDVDLTQEGLETIIAQGYAHAPQPQGVFGSRRACTRRSRWPDCKIRGQGVAALGTEGDHAGLIPFAVPNVQQRPLEIDVGDFEGEQLAAPDASIGEHGEHGSGQGATVGACDAVQVVEQVCDVVIRWSVALWIVELRRFDACRWVRRQSFCLHHPPRKGAYGGDVACDGAWA